jgi:preprotein translocase SecE subunit
MSDKTIGDEQQTGRRRRTGRRPEAAEAAETELTEDRSLTVGKGRATPSRRKQVEEEDSGNIATRSVGGVREYVEGVRTEIGKVVWPTREETWRLTLIVLATLVASAVVLGAISLIFTDLFKAGLTNPIILIGAMVIAVGGGVLFNRYSKSRSSSY